MDFRRVAQTDLVAGPDFVTGDAARLARRSPVNEGLLFAIPMSAAMWAVILVVAERLIG